MLSGYRLYLPLSMFEILAGPAHVWLWICAKLCGGTFEHGPGEKDIDSA